MTGSDTTTVVQPPSISKAFASDFVAKNGTVKFTQLKHFTGTVYAKAIDLSQQFTLTFRPVSVAGFNFGATASSHFAVTANAFKEVQFS